MTLTEAFKPSELPFSLLKSEDVSQGCRSFTSIITSRGVRGVLSTEVMSPPTSPSLQSQEGAPPSPQHHPSQEAGGLLRRPTAAEASSAKGETRLCAGRAPDAHRVSPVRGAFRLHQKLKLPWRAKGRTGHQPGLGGGETERGGRANLFFICTTSSYLIAVGITKPNILAWA